MSLSQTNLNTVEELKRAIITEWQRFIDSSINVLWRMAVDISNTAISLELKLDWM